MDFFNNLGKTLGKTAKNVTKKSEELVEITKLNLNIGSEEDKMKKLFLELGSELYNKFAKGEGVDGRFMEKCTQIKAIEDTIEALREKVKNLKAHNNSPEESTDTGSCDCTEAKNDASYHLDDNATPKNE